MPANARLQCCNFRMNLKTKEDNQEHLLEEQREVHNKVIEKRTADIF